MTNNTDPEHASEQHPAGQPAEETGQPAPASPAAAPGPAQPAGAPPDFKTATAHEPANAPGTNDTGQPPPPSPAHRGFDPKAPRTWLLTALPVLTIAAFYLLSAAPPPQSPTLANTTQAPQGTVPGATLAPGTPDLPLQTIDNAERDAMAFESTPYRPPDLTTDRDQNLSAFEQLEQTLGRAQEQTDAENALADALAPPAFTPIDEAEAARLEQLRLRKEAPAVMARPAEQQPGPAAQAIQTPTNPFAAPAGTGAGTPATGAESPPGPANPGLQTVQAPGPARPAETQPGPRAANRPGTDVAIYRPDQDYLLLQGSSLHVTLETAIDSNLPGTVRAISNMPVYSANGRHLLIPTRSRFIGEYASATHGQRRIFVIWQRIITPQGIEITLEAPAADPQGRSGVKGRLNRRFLERFGTAMIFTAISAFGHRNRSGDGLSLYYDSATRDAADIILENSLNLAPIIRIKPGALIAAQATRDIDFRAALTAFDSAHIEPAPDDFDEFTYATDPGTPPLNPDQDHNRAILQLADNLRHPPAPAPGTPAAPADTDAEAPVYLIPKTLFETPGPAPDTPAPPPDPCRTLVLKQDNMLSYHIETWATRCTNKPIEWSVGGADTWRDFIIESTRVIPLPRGSDSLAEFLRKHYHIHMYNIPERIILEDAASYTGTREQQ